MGTIPAMPDALSVDVFAELGRVTWAAIKLEDCFEDVCSHIDPANPRTDKRPVSAKIRDAQRVLAGRTRSAARDKAAEWLEHARLAMERRNASLHATPIVWVGRECAEDRLGLGEMPRQGRLYFERPLTAESLSEPRVTKPASSSWCAPCWTLRCFSGLPAAGAPWRSQSQAHRQDRYRAGGGHAAASARGQRQTGPDSTTRCGTPSNNGHGRR
jgi:hypothetical protein